MLTDTAKNVLAKRYFAEGEDWEALCGRVARKVAGTETHTSDRWSEIFKNMMMSLEFLPNSPVLRNYGRNQGSGSACFVLPIEDSRRSIFQTLADAVDIQAYGGGTGFSFSRLRPAGSLIKSTGGRASGPVSFLAIYDHTIGDIIKQGGTRNGANMAVLRVDHPDIELFIAAKEKEGSLKNFNLSVGITDAFMKAVIDDREYDLVFEGKVFKTVPARKIWGRIIEGAWANGEPGVVFLDTINRNNPLVFIGEIEATNPCGEQPLLPYGSCTLGSINLSRHVLGKWTKEPGKVDWEKLKKTVHNAVRFLDNVISANNYPIDRVKDLAEKTRQIGLGIMGFADLCIMHHVRYGSRQSIELAEKVMGYISSEAHKASVELAKEKGHAPCYDEMPDSQADEIGGEFRRNALLTTIAPTGTLSMIANCSSGCEPHFALEYIKECLDGEKLDLSPQVVKDWKKDNGDGPLPEFFVTAMDVTPQEHVEVQAAFQKYIDAGVSKTCNAPNDTDRRTVSEIFIQAWKSGCKGLTFYRDGSRQQQALVKAGQQVLERGEIKDRQRATAGPSFVIQTACGKMYVDPHFDSQELLEVFIRTIGGGCEANAEALGRLISLARRGGIHERIIAHTLKQVQCRACMKSPKTEVTSCAAGIGRAIEIAMEQKDVHIAAAAAMADADKNFSRLNVVDESARVRDGLCPKCGAKVYLESGCRTCVECGWSKCS